MSVWGDIKNRISSSPTKQKVFSNLFWAILGKVVNLMGSLLVGIFVAQYLGPEKYGLMNYVISVITIFQIVAQFGFDSIEIREESRRTEMRDSLIGTVFILRLILSIFAIITVVFYVFLFEEDAFTRDLVMIYSLSIVLSVFNVTRNHFTALVWNEYVVKTEISRTIIGICLKVVLLLCQASLIWFIWSLVFDAFLLASGYAISYKRKIASFRLWHFDMSVARYLICQSFPLLLSGAAIVIYQRIDQVMLGQMLDKSVVGQYSVAVRFVEVLVFIPTIIAQTVSPLLVKYHQENDMEYARKAEIFMNVTVWVCVLAAISLCVLSFPVVYFTFGMQYLPAVSILAIMSFKVIGAALSQTSGQLIIIEEKQKWVSIRNVIGCLVCVVLNYLVIRSYGAIGAAIVSIITIFSSGFIANYLIPDYRVFFRMQVFALLIGWKDIVHYKKLLR